MHRRSLDRKAPSCLMRQPRIQGGEIVGGEPIQGTPQAIIGCQSDEVMPGPIRRSIGLCSKNCGTRYSRQMLQAQAIEHHGLHGLAQ